LNPGSYDSAQAMSDKSKAVEQVKTSSRVFYTAVVVEYISNPEKDLAQETEFKAKSADDEAEEPLTLGRSFEIGENQVSNSSYVSRMPRNSIVGWRIDDRASYDSGPEIFFPMFSPHLMMPVSAGEQVWVTYENVGKPGQVGYWISRKPGSITTDDLCFTHQDRETMNVTEEKTQETSPTVAMEGSTSDEYDPLAFSLGGQRQSSNNTLPKLEWASATEDPYKDIIDSSFSYNSQFIGEPVPRWSPRSNDLCLQGSNNTLISLGTDRTFDADNSGNNEGSPGDGSDIKSFSGTIDIVAGRGADGTESAPAATATNPREWDEIDKTPTATKNADASNMFEGDVSFIDDLSRVYVSMSTNGDANLSQEDLYAFPDDENGSVDAVSESPYIIIKSNNSRIVARNDGSIRIIKEGAEDDDRAVITLEADGAIMIDGPKVTIGSGIESSNGAGDQVFIGRGATESIVLGDTLKSLLEDLISALNTHTHPTGVGPSSVPIPTDITEFTRINDALSTILSTVGKTK
jgi:hypothetical protein